MFRVGDKVFDIMRQEWGVVKRIDDSLYPINVKFEGEEFLCVYMADGRVSRHYKTPSLTFREFYLPEGWQEKDRFRASLQKSYYVVTSLGTVIKCIEDNSTLADQYYDCCNYFETKEEAKESNLYKSYKR